MDPVTPPSTSTKKRTITIAVSISLLVIIGVCAYALTRPDGVDSTSPAGISASSIKSISKKLPNGKTATYDDTEANRNIGFADSAKGMDYVDLTYASVDEFMKTADGDIVTRLCGADGERAQKDNVIVATMSTTVRMIEYPTENNCLDELATLRNTNGQLRTKAVELVAKLKSDIKQFYSSVVIK